jgi:AraC-like DNA-binding protein
VPELRSRELVSVVPQGTVHRVSGQRTVSFPSVSIDILATRRIDLGEWSLVRYHDPYWRLYWPISTGGVVEINGNRTPLEPGHFYLIPPHTTFSTTMTRPFQKWYAHFKLGRIADRALPGIHRFPATENVRRTVDQLAAAAANEPTTKVWNTVQFVAQALAFLPREVWENSRLDERVSRAMEFMSAHLSLKITTDQIARFAGLSVRNLNHLFQKELQQPPMRVLLDYRLDEACRLLRFGTLSIEEVAEQSGLVNRQYLSRMMRQHRNTTPAAYRDEQVWS